MLLGVMTEEDIRRTSGGESAEAMMVNIVIEKRATRLRVPRQDLNGREVLQCGDPATAGLPSKRGHVRALQNADVITTFCIAAERLQMIRAIYCNASVEPDLIVPESECGKSWERADAVRELLRGRMEVSGPMTISGLENILSLPRSEIDAGLVGLESEGFVLRGKFHPNAVEQEWCDRRLLARIHRLTIDRLRAEIQPVSIQDFYRFLFAWQRVDVDRRVEGPEGLQSVLEQLDGCELPLAAWESAVLSARVSDYEPEWLDRLCFSGRVGWARVSLPQHTNARAAAPLRTSPIALYQRENLQDWLMLSSARSTTEPAGAKQNGREGPRGFASGDASKSIELSSATQGVRDALAVGGALFFTELVRRAGLLPSQVEEALSELAALGFVTSDSFDGLRALLVPSNKRPTFGRNVGKRRRKTNLASIEFAGRWSLLRRQLASESQPSGNGAPPNTAPRDAAVEKFARVLLRRYRVVFRRLLERESFTVTWYELGRLYRRWEARGDIRGGYFVGGVSGEQFALPEAIGLLRSIRKASPKDELITLSAADPLNLQGILTPGRRIAALTTNRILFRDGLPIAALEAGETRKLATGRVRPTGGLSDDSVSDTQIETALKIGKLRPSLRPYYK